MRVYKRIKAASMVLLAFEISICIITSIYFFHSSYIETVVWFASVILFIILPQFYILMLLEKWNDKNKKRISKAADIIKVFDEDKLEYLRKFEEMEPLCNNILYINNKLKEIEKVDNILSEILVSAATNFELEKFFDEVMSKIIEVTDSAGIVFYSVNKTTNKLEIKASAGFGKSIYSQFDISIGEGYIGQAAAKNKLRIIKDIPEDSIYVSKTFIGKIKPKNIIVIPIEDNENENDVIGVLALTSIHEYTSGHIEILEKIKKYVAYAVINGSYFNKNQRLTNELKFQNQLIQNLNENLENKIKERTLFLNNIINSINDIAIISIDVNNKITLFNSGAEEILKISRSDAIGKNIQIIADSIENFKAKISELIKQVIVQGKIVEFYDVPRKDGSICSAQIELFSMYNEVGENNGITIVIRDTSYIKKLMDSAIVEKKLNDIMIEESTRALIVIGDNYKVETVNNNAEYILGVKDKKITEKKIWELFDDKDKIKEFIEEIFEGKEHDTMSLKLTNSDINITLKARLLSDKEKDIKKVLLYLH